MSGHATDVAVSGPYVYLADSHAGLHIFYSPPRLRLEAVGVAEGIFYMRLSGPAGVSAQLQQSTDLTNWMDLGAPVLLGEAPIPVSDPDASVTDRRFYRAVPP